MFRVGICVTFTSLAACLESSGGSVGSSNDLDRTSDIVTETVDFDGADPGDDAGPGDGELMGACLENGSCVAGLRCDRGVCVEDCQSQCTGRGCSVPCGGGCGTCPDQEWQVCVDGICRGRSCNGRSYAERCEVSEDCCGGLTCGIGANPSFGLFPVCLPDS